MDVCTHVAGGRVDHHRAREASHFSRTLVTLHQRRAAVLPLVSSRLVDQMHPMNSRHAMKFRRRPGLAA